VVKDDFPVKFYDHIQPIFSIHCVRCHGPETSKAGLRIDFPEDLLEARKDAPPLIVAGKSSESELFKRLTSTHDDERMPSKAPPLKPAQIEKIRQWIDNGAIWPDRDDYWAFQPVANPPVPASVSTDGLANPIDRFIVAQLDREKLVPNPRAESVVLLRRAYFDLVGVPPSPEEARAFLEDRSPDAWPKLVEKLLADPRYGERWARHWLDLVRYGESDGYEDDKIRHHAWHYRDYVIRAFNADKPYNRFVEEHIAGDELYPDDADALIATGFARLGAWDDMSKEPKQQWQNFLNDTTDCAGSVFLGMTVGCARCHDHKFDRITQQDYYAFQAFFAGIQRTTADLPPQFSDPSFVTEAHAAAAKELAALKQQREALIDEARETIRQKKAGEAPKAAEGTKPAEIKIKDDEINKQCEAAHPGRKAELDTKIKEQDYLEKLNRSAAEVVIGQSAATPGTRLLKGGELNRPGENVAPAFIAAIATEAPKITVPANKRCDGRRSALAHWLTGPQNPLVARVIVNRVWQHHFGRGIVASPSDFGRNAQPPTHPALLDFLAARFVADGWSIKALHRLIMNSEAYRRSSSGANPAAQTDPLNHWLWRMNRQRLDAEALRDSMLFVSGQLSATRGGPGVYARLPKGINIEFPNNIKALSWGTCTDEEDRRRSIYLFQRRTLTFPLIEVFDGPTMNQTCAARPQTTVAPQALALFNGEFCREQARHFAARVRGGVAGGRDARIERAYWFAFSRAPVKEELDVARAFLETQEKQRSGVDAEAAAWTDFCHVLLNTNEFISID
jgi:hypothetical protein